MWFENFLLRLSWPWGAKYKGLFRRKILRFWKAWAKQFKRCLNSWTMKPVELLKRHSRGEWFKNAIQEVKSNENTFHESKIQELRKLKRCNISYPPFACPHGGRGGGPRSPGFWWEEEASTLIAPPRVFDRTCKFWNLKFCVAINRLNMPPPGIELVHPPPL